MSDIARQGLESQEAASTAPAESSSAKQRARKGLANASYEEQQQQLTPAEVESGGPPTELKQLYQYEGFEELESKLGADPVAKPLLLDWLWSLLGLGESAKAPATDAQSQSKGTASNTPAITVPPATTNAPPPPQVTGLAAGDLVRLVLAGDHLGGSHCLFFAQFFQILGQQVAVVHVGAGLEQRPGGVDQLDGHRLGQALVVAGNLLVSGQHGWGDRALIDSGRPQFGFRGHQHLIAGHHRQHRMPLD